MASSGSTPGAVSKEAWRSGNKLRDGLFTDADSVTLLCKVTT